MRTCVVAPPGECLRVKADVVLFAAFERVRCVLEDCSYTVGYTNGCNYHHYHHLQNLFRHIGINSLTLSVSLIHILVFYLLITLHRSDPHCHLHLCHHHSLLLFFTLDLKDTSSSSLFHPRLHHRLSLIHI